MQPNIEYQGDQRLKIFCHFKSHSSVCLGGGNISQLYNGVISANWASLEREINQTKVLIIYCHLCVSGRC